MKEDMANNKCKECGCACSKCISSDHDVHLHVEIENLKQRLLERDNHILSMETNFLNEANKFPNGEIVAIREELLTWQDKYKRLYEAHRRVQRVNQGLEDKLLKLVDVCETDKSTLTKDVATLSHKLADANYTIKKLTEDNERYKNDVALAIQFLQCKPGNFVAQKVDSLPNEVQAKVSSYMASKRKPEEKKTPPEIKSIKVPIPTFPPTAMVYSIPKSPSSGIKLDRDLESASVDIVSAAIMAKVLEERERERANVKHCDTCTCSKNITIIHYNTHHSVSTQTVGESKTSLCLKCNSNIQQNVKVIKNGENLKTKTFPIYYIHDYVGDSTNVSQNVAKVQPNNFLTDSKNFTGSNLLKKNNFKYSHEGSGDYEKVNCVSINTEIVNSLNNVLLDSVSLILSNNNDVVSSSSKNSRDDESYQGFNVNSNEATKLKVSETLMCTDSLSSVPHKSHQVAADHHHRLCDQTTNVFENKSNQSAKDVSRNLDLPKGPRYCSMRLQSGSKNILLDNTHNNVAPILYTKHPHHQQLQEKKTFNPDDNSESLYSEDYKNSTMSDSSFYNQRVAEWIENNMDVSASDNSRSDSLGSLKTREIVSDIDKVKYVEMENNVKRFLFGESEFLKTVEIGKRKYQSYRESDDSLASKNSTSKSHTETEI